jgi:hypothetical protein
MRERSGARGICIRGGIVALWCMQRGRCYLGIIFYKQLGRNDAQ